ncbi:transposase [Breznakia blatticola]|uniref:Transposase n=1 Tax=Breznakia blatticola TaxID=1754012 RepID=A0A4R7Z871_9FIRM|nr:ISL3 family transposase [Breznakia blatticola]TDW07794.1 transposase [Breznakia blatticola]
MKQEPRILNDQTILQLFNLSPDKVEKIAFENRRDALYIMITLSKEEQVCPVCLNKTSKVKDYTKKKILHAAITHKACYIEYRARRYICPTCKKSFAEHNPFSYKNQKLSALTVSNVLADLKSSHETFTSVAKRYGISTATVTTLFDTHVQIARRRLPKYLTIDEVYAFKSDRSNYVCVLVDYLNKTTVDLLPSRKKQDLLLYFNQIPLEERKEVLLVGIDMWHTYRSVTKIAFPKAKCVLDKFHLIAEFHKRLDKLRIQIMKEIQPPKAWKKSSDIKKQCAYHDRDKQYYLLKKFNWLLMKNDESIIEIDNKKWRLLDPNIPKKKNRKLGRYCNYYDIREMILEIDQRLITALNLKYTLDTFYKEATLETAKTKLESLILDMSNSEIPGFVSFSHTLINWKNEIINSFQLIEKVIQVKDKETGKMKHVLTRKRLNNGIIENRNKVIKQIKHNSNGFHNWERFRNRVLYAINDDSTYRIYSTKL